jgi:hypothetical protein
MPKLVEMAMVALLLWSHAKTHDTHFPRLTEVQEPVKKAASVDPLAVLQVEHNCSRSQKRSKSKCGNECGPGYETSENNHDISIV